MDKTIFMELLHAREFKAVRSILNVMNAVDIAALMTELEDKELAQAFRLIPKSKAADVFAEMNSSMQSYLVKIFTEDELKDLLNELFLDDTVDLLEDLPANLVTRILENVDNEKRNRINQLLNYPEDSAGSVMTTEYVDLRKHAVHSKFVIVLTQGTCDIVFVVTGHIFFAHNRNVVICSIHGGTHQVNSTGITADIFFMGVFFVDRGGDQAAVRPQHVAA